MSVNWLFKFNHNISTLNDCYSNETYLDFGARSARRPEIRNTKKVNAEICSEDLKRKFTMNNK